MKRCAGEHGLAAAHLARDDDKRLAGLDGVA
jgi:hypothetical protein